MAHQKILVTGPFGQVGAELVPELQRMHGVDNVVALGHHRIPEHFSGVIEKADIGDVPRLR
jgi:nucleoside-diphosphate-sugar epimerase